VAVSSAAPTPVYVANTPSAVPAAAPAPAVPAAPEAPAEDEGHARITSPMVGTFYRSPTPEADAFAKVGDVIDEDTVVCVIEAMKVMNEIKAEVRGTIREVLIENATPVEFGEPLFLVELS
jgi:acetyl-CoA carboxylase biotin carboxyl carrier protein